MVAIREHAPRALEDAIHRAGDARGERTHAARERCRTRGLGPGWRPAPSRRPPQRHASRRSSAS
jgi:hypothetical protein